MNLPAQVGEEKEWGVEYPGHKRVKAEQVRNPAMHCENHMSGWLPCHKHLSKNPETHWRHKCTGAPPPNRCRQPTPEPTLLLHSAAPAQTGNNCGAPQSQIVNWLAGYAYVDTAHPSCPLHNLDACAQDCQHDTDDEPWLQGTGL